MNEFIYFVLFGCIVIRIKNGQFLGGQDGKLTVGCTIGEEVLYSSRAENERAIAVT